MAVAERDEDGEVIIDKRGLPPIHRIKMPPMSVTSTKIRWLDAIGYIPREIAPYLGIRYQQVRNVLQNPPKRASREDIPPLIVEILAISDDNLELMDQHAFNMEMAAHKKSSRTEQRATNKARRKLKATDQTGNEDLDDENYIEEPEA